MKLIRSTFICAGSAIALLGLMTSSIMAQDIFGGDGGNSPAQPNSSPQGARVNPTPTLPERSSEPIECDGQEILTASTCIGDGLESEERRLYNLINAYRADNGLPPIPLSPSLTIVANRHVLDLDQNIGSLTHAWSDCPYDASDDSTYPCMWNAPQRLGTAYEGYGYENAHGGSGRYRATAESALRSWQGSMAHNAVILNQGMWQDRAWRALGVGIHRGYAVLWFGEEVDPAPMSQ